MSFGEMGKKKKKKKNKEKVTEALPAVFDLNNVEGHEKFEYSWLLDRIESIMQEKNIGASEEEEKEERPIVKPVSIKTAWVNFESIRTKIDRPTQHMLDYFST